MSKNSTKTTAPSTAYPLPWKSTKETYAGHGGDETRWYIRDKDGEIILMDLSQSLAGLLVSKVNTHAALLAALEKCVAALNVAFNYDGDVFGVHHNDTTDAISEAESAIAAARKEQE